MKKYLFLILFLSSPCWAGDIVIYSTSSTPEHVIAHLRSVNTPDYDSRVDVVVNPDLSLLDGIVALKYWKHSAGNIVEMTGSEKSDVDAAEVQASSDSIRGAAKERLDDFTNVSMLEKAFLDALIDEVNLLRENHYGMLAVSTGTTSQSLTQDVWAKVTAFNTSQGIVGISTGSVTVSTTNSNITTIKIGDYMVNYNVSFNGSNSLDVSFSVGLSGDIQNQCKSRRDLDNSGDTFTVSASCIINVDTQPKKFTIQARANSGSSPSITTNDAQLTVFRIHHLKQITLSDTKTVIKNKIDSGDLDND